MINISIDSATGNINISQESVEERATMQRVYDQLQNPATTAVHNFSTSVAEGEAYDAGFKGGWAAAVQETQLRFVNGQLLDFYNEQGTPSYTMDGVSQVDLESSAKEFEESYGSQDPHYMEPVGTGEDDGGGWGETTEPLKDDRDETPVVEVVTDNFLSHRPTSTQDPHSDDDTKEDPEFVEPGTWTMSAEELKSRLDAEYQRGLEDGVAINIPSITKRTLMGKAHDVVAADTVRTFANGQGTPTRFDDAFGPSVENFVVPLAKALGFKVVD